MPLFLNFSLFPKSLLLSHQAYQMGVENWGCVWHEWRVSGSSEGVRNLKTLHPFYLHLICLSVSPVSFLKVRTSSPGVNIIPEIVPQGVCGWIGTAFLSSTSSSTPCLPVSPRALLLYFHTLSQILLCYSEHYLRESRSSCVTLSKLVYLSEPQFSNL